MTIERLDGRRVRATYVRHLRTLSWGGHSDDVDLYRLKDGTEIQCMSPENDGLAMPVECDPAAGHYPGYPPGV